MESGQGWDFNAPQFIDFTKPVEDENVDQYFEFDHESGVPVDLGDDVDGADGSDMFTTPNAEIKKETRAVSKTPKQKTETPRTAPAQRVTRAKSTSNLKTPTAETASQESIEVVTKPAVTPLQDELSTPSPRVLRSGKCVDQPAVEPASGSAKAKPSNLCTNLEEWRKKTANSKTNTVSQPSENEPKPASKRQHRSLDRSASVKKPRTEVEQRRSGVTGVKSSGVQRSSSFNRSGHNQSTDSGSGPQIRHTRGLSGDRREGSGSAAKKPDSEKGKAGGMTIPSTPSFMKRKPMKSAAASQIKPAEERELEKVAFYRKELARKRKIAEESCKIALAGKGPTAPVAPKHMTKPEEFKFETDARIKAPHPPPTVEEVKDFASCLRSDTGKQAPGPMKAGPTIPEPFKLSSGQQRKRKLPDLDEKQAEKYETMAEKLAAFTKTPDRFRSRPKGGASDEKRGRSRSPPHGPTVPHTPQFETRSRSRPVTAPSREEIEQQELEEMQKNQFKAQPVNTKIFQNPSLKKVMVKAPTVPEEFHLSHNLKAHDKEAKQEEEHFEFHAKPLNKKILEGTVGLKEPKRLPLTKPESPAFALKHRTRIPAPEEQTEPEKPTTRRRPIPHTGVPFQIQLSHKTTEPEPFAFEEREKRRVVERERKIEQILEEEAKKREFHAQPLPDHEPHLPPKRTRPLTVQKPFNLDTDVRGAKKTEEWLKKVLEEEELEAKEKTRFKAREAVVLDQEPFVPQKENKCTADITEFELSTAKRHLKREAYETSKKQRQDELDNIRHQEQLIREAEERAELERLRREAVHKAEPVKHYKSLPIRPSSKPLTEALSPHFHTDERLRTRSKHSDSSLST